MSEERMPYVCAGAFVVLVAIMGKITPGSMLAVFLPMVIVGAAVLVYFYHKKRKEEIEAIILLMEEEEELKTEFYNECVKNNIYSLKNSFKRQKAELIAQRLGCKYSDFSEYFDEVMEKCGAEARQREQEEFEQKQMNLRSDEIRKHDKLTKFARYEGRDKRIAILEYMQGEYLKKANDMRESAEAGKQILRASQQSEINWGIVGGIASGLAGGAAGIAAAVDAQNQNSRIRAQNKANLEALAPGILGIMDSAYQYEAEAEELQVSIDDAKIKVVSDQSSEKVMKYLRISNDSATISSTGAFSVKADVQLKDGVKLEIEDMDAVVDGSIFADLYQKGKRVGRAVMVLPTFGIGKATTIEGICLSGAEENVPYELKFCSRNLWIMEE